MNSSKFCTITLQNKTYDIKCPEGKEENLKLAAQRLNSHLKNNKKKFKQLDDFKQLLLAAIHVSYDLICHEQQVAQSITALTKKKNHTLMEESIVGPETD